MVPAPRRLRVEHLEEALGIDVATPRLSWQLAEPVTRQDAYRLEVGAWNCDWVESDECVLVAYEGPAVESRTSVEWRVQVRTDAGVSEWSEWSRWETGLLRVEDWTAQWISPVEASPLPAAGERPAAVLRKHFTTGPRTSARIYATAHGIYELFLDGERVGDQELAPGFTSYRSRVQVQTYDVTTSLDAGEHELRAVLSDGWYRGKVGFTREHDVFGSRLALLAQVEVGRSAHPGGRPRLASGRCRRRRLRRPVRVTGATGAPGRAAAASERAGARARSACGRPRPEHQRMGPDRRPRSGGHGARPHVRRGARCQR
jgi:alpha-L-rhamnosidase